MRIIDLTHTISEDMPVYPGTEPPRLCTANTIEKDGFRETLLTMYSHTGTHMDAPAHILRDGTTLDGMPAERFAGRALAIDCSDVPHGGTIDMAHIEKYGQAAHDADFLLFCTGFSGLWGTPEYFGDFPVCSDAALQFMIDTGKKGIGVDAISIDPIGDSLPRHMRVLGSGMVIIENLAGLAALLGKTFDFYALPLKYKNADGAPVRAIAVL